jgi:cobalamin biosynthesis protein CobT
LGASGAGPGGGNAIDPDGDDDDNEEDDDYNDDASDSNDDNNDDDDDKEAAPEEADAPPEGESARQVRLLAGVVRTNKDDGLGHMVRLPDASANAPAVFEAVELQDPTFFVSHLVVRAGGFSREDPPTCLVCLR